MPKSEISLCEKYIFKSTIFKHLANIFPTPTNPSLVTQLYFKLNSTLVKLINPANDNPKAFNPAPPMFYSSKVSIKTFNLIHFEIPFPRLIMSSFLRLLSSIFKFNSSKLIRLEIESPIALLPSPLNSLVRKFKLSIYKELF